jgi:RecA/RadA recombinase
MPESDSVPGAAPRRRGQAAPSAPPKPARKVRSRAANAKAEAAAQKAANLANALLDPDLAFGPLVSAVAETDAGVGMVDSMQAELMLIGILLPSLALRWMFGQDILTLGRLLQIVGKKHSCKTALLCEMYRWFLIHKGLVAHIETENKDAPDLRNSILLHDPVLMRRVQYCPADSQQHWMEILTNWLNKAEDQFAKVKVRDRSAKQKANESAAEFRARAASKERDDRIGWCYPMIYGVDSLTAVSADGTIAAIKASGAPKDRFANEARYLTDYLRTMPSNMRNRPIFIATTNHLKEGMADQRTGHVPDKVPGGVSAGFMDTSELKLERIGAPVEASDHEGRRVKMTLTKNCSGPDGRSIVVDLTWWFIVDPVTDKLQQRTAWDWDAATIDMLLAQKTRKGAAGLWDEINAIVDLHLPTTNKRKVIWSEALGIPKDKPVRYREAGAMLERRPDLLGPLYKVLHIHTRTKFTPGVDYTDVKEQLKRSAERTAPIYAPPDLSAVADIGEELDAAQAEALAAAAAEEDDDD